MPSRHFCSIRFNPSMYSEGSTYGQSPGRGEYGWSSGYSEQSLTRSGKAKELGISNTPDAAAQRNLSKVSDFLGKLPWKVNVTSGYRSPAVNTAIGGASSSAHMTGAAVDFNVPGMTNKEVANWLYENQSRFPELDQIIWYMDSGHVHVQVAQGSGRKQFLAGKKEGHEYVAWSPSLLDTSIPGVGASSVPMTASIIGATSGLTHTQRIAMGVGLLGVFGLVAWGVWLGVEQGWISGGD